MTQSGLPSSGAAPSHDRERLLRRVRSEFLEMPGLHITEPQARRLWDLDAPTCTAVLDELVSTKFLVCTAYGAYVRLDRAASAKGCPAPGSRASAA